MKPVVLVPGLGTGGIELVALRRRLCKAGFDARIYHYCAWRGTVETQASGLEAFAEKTFPCMQADFVGHSLGGLIAAHLCATRAARCRLVTLGTPHLGNVAAARVRRLPGGRRLLGPGFESAIAAAPAPLTGATTLGTIAGDLNVGVGLLLRVPRPNDSVVTVAEAQHPGASGNVTLPVSHAAMLISSRVAVATARFLRAGAFV